MFNEYRIKQFIITFVIIFIIKEIMRLLEYFLFHI